MGGAKGTCRWEQKNRNETDRRLTGSWPSAGSLFFVLLAVAGSAGATDGATPDSLRRDQIVRMVRQDCGSCHGMTLKGGLGPALTPGALRGKAPESLAATIVVGRPGTAMPPWRAFLTEREAVWVVRELMEGRIGDR